MKQVVNPESGYVIKGGREGGWRRGRWGGLRGLWSSCRAESGTCRSYSDVEIMQLPSKNGSASMILYTTQNIPLSALVHQRYGCNQADLIPSPFFNYCSPLALPFGHLVYSLRKSACTYASSPKCRPRYLYITRRTTYLFYRHLSYVATTFSL